MDYEALERVLGHTFQDKALLETALTHTSFANEARHGTKHNERLEFLGDSVLSIVVAEYLFTHSSLPEGDLTRMRASLVCEPTLAYCAADLELGSYLLLGKGEEATGGRERNSVVSDAMEALIGSIYLDGGFANAKEFIHRFILNDIEHKQLFYDSKTILQEMIQATAGAHLEYEILREEGPDHHKVFEVRALSGGEELGRGTGGTKKAAEAVAAYHGILKLRGKECI